MIGRALLAALLLLSSSVRAEPSRCLGPVVATLPLVPAGDKSAIPVLLNGVPRHLVLDTGATHLALARDAVRDLGLVERHTPHAVLAGIGGFLSHAVVDVGALTVGGLRFAGVDIPVITVGMPDIDGRPAAGVLGTPVLSRFDVALDFRDHRMSLFRAATCDDIGPIWPGRWARLPMEVEPGNLDSLLRRVDLQAFSAETGVFQGDPVPSRTRLYTVVRVNGLVMVAAVDSGAAVSSITLDAARRAGLSTGGPRIDMIGTDLHPIVGHRAGARVEIGDEAIMTPLAVADISAGHADLLLGHDLMERRRMLISFSTRQLFWQSEAAALGGYPPWRDRRAD